MKTIKSVSSIKSKFVMIFLLVGLLPVLSVAVLSYYNAKGNIEAEVMGALDMYAGLTDSQVSSFFTERESDAKVYVASANVFEALSTLQSADWDETDPGWIAQKSRLDRFTKVTVEENGYSFIFLTDPQGRAVYSSREGVEGADLSIRDYVQRSLRGEINWSGLFYSGIVNDNTIVVSLPVRTGGLSGDLIGTANMVITTDILGSMAQQGIQVLGKTGDAYLVSAEGLLYTNTLWGELAKDAALNETIDTKAVQMLAGPVNRGDRDFHQQGVYDSYLGKRVLGSVNVIRLGDGYAGLVVEIEEAEAFTGVYAMRNYLLAVLFVAVFLVAGVGYVVATNTAKPIVSVAAVAQKVAGGDFTVSTDIQRQDEIGQLADAFNVMNGNLRALIQQAVQTAKGVNEGSEALSQSVESVSASLAEVAASTDQFSGNTQELSSGAQEMAGLSSGVASSAKAGSEAIEDAVRQMQEINEMVEGLRTIIGALDKRSQEIGSIVSLITDVADQTNLLALNAAIEAARAGEMGRGFAVVAEEVRKLAEQSRSAAEDIETLVKITQDETKQAVSSMENGVEKVRSGSEVVLASGTAFREIVDNVNGIVAKINIVSSFAQEISAGSQEIAASTEEQSAVMEEINASAEELRANADALIQELSRFKYE